MKRAISLILAVILILSVTMLAGCGSENETSTDNHSSSHSTDESNDGNAENGDSESGSAVDNGSDAADGSGDGDAEASGEQSSASPAAEAAKGEVADGLEVIAEEYHASEYLGVLLLIVKNNTGTVIQLKATADFYDESGELLNTDDDWEDDVAPAQPYAWADYCHAEISPPVRTTFTTPWTSGQLTPLTRIFRWSMNSIIEK